MRGTTTAEEQKLSKKLRTPIDSTNQRAKRTKDLLELLKQETGENKLNTFDVRVRESMNKLLTKKCIDVIKMYQQAQQKYKIDIRKKVKRQGTGGKTRCDQRRNR
jgi:t-SNARE complex subunit (syntaxin)